MKKGTCGFLATVLLASFFIVACACPSKEVRGGGVSVVVGTPMVEISKTAQVVLYGTGFAPKQEVLFLFKDVSGVPTVVSNDTLKPEPVPNEVGAWVTVWDCSQYMSLIKPGTLMITVTDKDYKTLAQVPVAFFTREKKEKK